MKKQFLICCLILYGCVAHAQLQASSFERYTVQQGLSDNNVFCITQDDLGYIWLGTENGLNRFDGNVFQSFYHDTSSYSIPGNHVLELKRTGLHEILVLTQKGLQQVNTTTLARRNYLLPETERTPANPNRLTDVVKLKNGAFAISTSVGFYVMHANGGLAYAYNRLRGGYSGSEMVNYGRNIFLLPDHNALLFTKDEGVSLYIPATNTFVRYRTALPAEWSAFYPPGEDWIARYQMDSVRFMLVHSRQRSFTYYNAENGKVKVSAMPSVIHDDLSEDSRIFPLSKGRFAITSGGSGYYTFELNEQTGVVIFDENRSLKGYKCNYLFMDKEERLWVGTSNGLLYEKKEQPLFTSYMLNDYAAEGYSYFCYLTRYKDRLYLAKAARQPHITVVDTATMKVIKKVTLPGYHINYDENPSIQCYYPDTLWIGTNDGITWLDTKNYHSGKVALPEPLQHGRVALNPVMENGDTWMIRPWGGVVAKYNIHTRQFTCYTNTTNPRLPFERPKQVVYDAYGDAWLSGYGLARWNYKTHRFDTLMNRYNGLNKDEDNILSITADSRGSLWLHSFENGLQEYRIKEKRFIGHSLLDGVSFNALVSLSNKEVAGKIWFSTPSNQIGNINLQTGSSNIYGTKDGIPEGRPSARYIFYDEAADQCYALLAKYLIRFRPSAEPVVRNNNNILIEQVAAPNALVHYPGDTVEFPYKQNNLSIRFTLINYNNTSSYHFYYRLNESTSWVPLRNQRTINMTSLSPGKYTLYIKALDRNQDEKTKQLLIIIHPPFWNTWWFITLSTLLLVAAVLSLLKWRELVLRRAAAVKFDAQAKQNEEMKGRLQLELELAVLNQQLTEMEMKALHAQMNPHFIFNCLNSIVGMIIYQQNEDASRYLNKFAQLIRENLDHSKRSFITLQQNINYLHNYLKMEQIRFTNFEYEMKVDALLDTEEIMIAPMLIQPLAENAIWHGLQAIEEKKQLKISFSKEKDYLVCEIEDNGVGINKTKDHHSTTKHLSMGIENIQKRILLLRQKYNTDCVITFTDKGDRHTDETGTIVTLTWKII
ncbi:sensor histidine kinase [Chitinophaga niabensis]|uniref:Sensor histidine kinase YesM n=1 Tax=Chitinophaga niabensis TaxID=536979 RepID=A0A1N6F5W2_9BACT|nr:histidine kinase [Chitinophaga niabensis]SIN90657.1 Sensor histidine kinase YesM [Chitinophaga niabensis]